MTRPLWNALSTALLLASALACSETPQRGNEVARGRVYEVVELDFSGPEVGTADTPARDIDLDVLFRHESGAPEYRVFGFWDGDGRSGASGNVFKVRFLPTEPGRWVLVEVASNRAELDGQQEGNYVTAEASEHPGFWIVDDTSPGRRWYQRSDGSHPYIYGNTHYSFLSGTYLEGKPSGNDITADIRGNAAYFKKLRFGLHGDRYPHPTEKPYLDDAGQPTDRGDFSHRPNPAWFRDRVDRAVQEAYAVDLIADLILAGPDEETSRSTLRAGENEGDATPFLKYIAARYGSYPNVWITLANEYEIRTPTYTETELAHFGQTIDSLLPYPTPLSVHSTPSTLWAAAFDSLPAWSDHMIIQDKIRHLAPAADVIEKARRRPDGSERNMPVINDELSYQGEGDQHDEGDTIESHLGIFLGGGYGTTGEKPGNKLGQYFRGKFDASEHTAVDNLQWLREQIDANITFWQMAPSLEIFSNLDADFRGMAWPGREYVLGTNKAHQGIVADLPAGTWEVTRYDVMSKDQETLSPITSGRYTFDAPASRAVLFHFMKRPE